MLELIKEKLFALFCMIIGAVIGTVLYKSAGYFFALPPTAYTLNMCTVLSLVIVISVFIMFTIFRENIDNNATVLCKFNAFYIGFTIFSWTLLLSDNFVSDTTCLSALFFVLFGIATVMYITGIIMEKDYE